MLIEAILAGFLTFGLPPATTPPKPCTNWSKRVGCSTNTGGARDNSESHMKDVSERAGKGGMGGGKGNARAK